MASIIEVLYSPLLCILLSIEIQVAESKYGLWLCPQPEIYQDIHRDAKTPPVLYLLHGCPHNHSVWQRYTALERYAEELNLAIIMPEANRSFYTDMKYGVDYFSYISRELPDLCERMFGISSDPAHRYISGLSMGGYGCLKISLSNPSAYRACFALSALSDIRLHIHRTKETDPKIRDYRAVFGPELTPPDGQDVYYLAKQALLSPSRPALYFYCGLQDGMYPEVQDLDDYLQKLHYPVTSKYWDGIHDWKFWDEAIQLVLHNIDDLENA